MQTNILLVEDDASLSTVLADYLRSKDYTIETANNGKEAWELIMIKHYDLIISDIMMPRMNGFELLRDIRRRYMFLPIIILTNRNDRESQMRAFQLGCDDYQFKPFSMDILICRIEAILRRVRMREESKQRVFHLGEHVFDATHQTFDGQHLSSKESDLLLLLCRYMGDTVDKHHILTAIWKEDNALTARSLGVYINHLRHFLTPAGYTIIAARGKGYKLICNH